MEPKKKKKKGNEKRCHDNRKKKATTSGISRPCVSLPTIHHPYNSTQSGNCIERYLQRRISSKALVIGRFNPLPPRKDSWKRVSVPAIGIYPPLSSYPIRIR